MNDARHLKLCALPNAEMQTIFLKGIQIATQARHWKSGLMLISEAEFSYHHALGNQSRIFGEEGPLLC